MEKDIYDVIREVLSNWASSDLDNEKINEIVDEIRYEYEEM